MTIHRRNSVENTNQPDDHSDHDTNTESASGLMTPSTAADTRAIPSEIDESAFEGDQARASSDELNTTRRLDANEVPEKFRELLGIHQGATAFALPGNDFESGDIRLYSKYDEPTSWMPFYVFQGNTTPVYLSEDDRKAMKIHEFMRGQNMSGNSLTFPSAGKTNVAETAATAAPTALTRPARPARPAFQARSTSTTRLSGASAASAARATDSTRMVHIPAWSASPQSGGPSAMMVSGGDVTWFDNTGNRTDARPARCQRRTTGQDGSNFVPEAASVTFTAQSGASQFEDPVTPSVGGNQEENDNDNDEASTRPNRTARQLVRTDRALLESMVDNYYVGDIIRDLLDKES
ncbi:hypothetical protein V866_004620 [Kwoniella sp. B9012]|uniref:Uncharacterized protein n=1 Tax=Kwoniella europaea PYCC6329 TaxID=1423913 RepID=A0AAX4KKL6_9TREE